MEWRVPREPLGRWVQPVQLVYLDQREPRGPLDRPEVRLVTREPLDLMGPEADLPEQRVRLEQPERPAQWELPAPQVLVPQEPWGLLGPLGIWDSQDPLAPRA